MLNLIRRILRRKTTVAMFINAAKYGEDFDLVIIRRYIAANHDINAFDQYGNTALIWAACKGRAPIVTALLAVDEININALCQYGNTALIWAAIRGYASIVTALLAADGIDINAVGEYDTALGEAAKRGHTSIVTALLARIDTIKDLTRKNDLNRLTAAEEAEESGHYDIANLITARISDLRARLASPRRVVSVSPAPQEKLDEFKFTGVVPLDFVCPIAADGCVMHDPVTVSSGKTFERANLIRWCSIKLNRITKTFPCPLTRNPIHERELNNESTTIVTNAIAAFVEEQVAEEKTPNRVVSVSPIPQEKFKFTDVVPLDFVCPIAVDGCVMRDPVTVSSGKTFERINLIRWCSRRLDPVTKTFPCPVTHNPIHERELYNESTTLVKNAIVAFLGEKKDVLGAQNQSSIVLNESVSSASSDSQREMRPLFFAQMNNREVKTKSSSQPIRSSTFSPAGTR